MAKPRKSIPRAIKDEVLKEFNHRCAVCGTDRPQLHHIDEDPSNNDPLNIIPLCPNCHLINQHDPTQPIDGEKLVLFRKYKDPLILKSQFHSLFKRLKFLNSITDDSDAHELDTRAEELVDFISEMKMGSFYAKKLAELLRMVHTPKIIMVGSAQSKRFNRETREKDRIRYLVQLKEVREKVKNLVVECLRYQNWD